MIKVIIFDLGNVVFGIDFQRVFRYWSDKSHFNSDFLHSAIHHQFERGEVSSDNFKTEVNKIFDMRLSMEDFDKGWNQLYLPIFEGVEPLLASLRDRYTLIAFSNTNILHASIWRKLYQNTLVHFHHIYTSFEIGFRKPEKEGFKYIIHQLGLNPNEIIFLDDNLENVEAARELSIQSILVENTEQMILDLHSKIR